MSEEYFRRHSRDNLRDVKAWRDKLYQYKSVQYKDHKFAIPEQLIKIVMAGEQKELSYLLNSVYE